MSLFYFFPTHRLGRVVLTFYVPIAVLGLFFWRLYFFKALHERRGDNNLLLIGRRDESQLLIEELKMYPVREYNPISVMCEDEKGFGKTIAGVPIIDNNKDLERLNNHL